MKCIICKNETEAKSNQWVETVCLACEANMNESRTRADRLQDEYYEQHAVCPRCYCAGHTTTLMAFIFDVDHPEAYVDRNDCTCNTCGDRHIAHDRVPKIN